MFVGTQYDNMRDCKNKGRNSVPPKMVGEQHPNAKLTDATARRILRLHADGCGVGDISRLTNATKCTVRHVVRRESWKHI
jgi:DNA-binding NarL/FixJ family response regulator